MSSYVELYMDQGASFNTIINITDDETNTYANIYGYSVTSQMRKSYYTANSVANLSCQVTNSSNGEITISMTAANTSLIKAGRYVFDVKTIDQTNATKRVLEGIINVTPSVTR